MHVVAILAGLILLASFLLRVALKRPLDGGVARTERWASLFSGLTRIPYVSRPVRVAWVCVDFANFIFLLGYAILIAWAVLVGPIRPVHEWLR
jgi:hypothetical protein